MQVLLVGVHLLSMLGGQESWRDAWDDLAAERDRMSTGLEAAKEAILRRAPEWTERLEESGSTAARPRGWGRLAEVLEDDPDRPQEVFERRYSLATIGDWFAPDVEAAAELPSDLPAPIDEETVAEWERLQRRFDLYDEHLAYHERWQAAVVEDAEFFRDRNEVLALARDWKRRRGEPGSQARLQELSDRLDRFRTVEGLELERSPQGWRLPVRVRTDIGDDEFLAAFAEAVNAYWSDRSASDGTPFAVELELVRVDLAELYDDVPELGDELDLGDHLERFPPGFVLTTGAASTYANVGRSIVLGPTAHRPRTLAHEFGHLLGFRDAYLRAYEGDPDSPTGAVLVEMYGLFEDLMGNSRGGVVTAGMVDQLVRAYAPE